MEIMCFLYNPKVAFNTSKNPLNYLIGMNTSSMESIFLLLGFQSQINLQSHGMFHTSFNLRKGQLFCRCYSIHRKKPLRRFLQLSV